jgi:hypothetical protein
LCRRWPIDNRHSVTKAYLFVNKVEILFVQSLALEWSFGKVLSPTSCRGAHVDASECASFTSKTSSCIM